MVHITTGQVVPFPWSS